MFDTPIGINPDYTERRWIGNGYQVQRRFGAAVAMELHKLRNIEISEYIAVDHDEGLVDTDCVGGEPNSTRSIKWRWFDGVVQRDASAHAGREGFNERFRLEAERECDVGDAATPEIGNQSFDDWQVTNRQHRLRNRKC